ncbi:CRISPR-associated helicase Cas3' [Aerococcus christensenii]|uniref:CRISPR-associated helicase Cas3' n=1 Tax=Aerococcus christensenii TaxID=87541 RepID=UPI001F01C3BA|nr:CRISPR-associated helicase Cas3' [Aerococcus christensenii]
MAACHFACVDDLPLISQPGQVILSGLLIMADWIASNEKYFPLIAMDTDKVESNRVEKGFTKWYRDRAETWEPESYCNDSYQKRFGFEPREVQKKVSDILSKMDNPGIVIMEAPMGIGKTETALVAVEEFAQKTNRTGIFFGLPTQATSNGIFSRVEDWLKHGEGEKSIRLIHGKAQLNDQFANLPKSRNIHSEDSVGVNEWFAGRKVAILDDFTVGTVDQILLAALKQKHLMLRHLGFANKVVVIDEVHAYDAYMSVYLYQALMWLGAYGVPVILLSATLPISKRNELLKQYMVGAGYGFKKLDKPQDFDKNENYPLLTYNDGETINQFSQFNNVQGIDYEIVKKTKEDSQDIIGFIRNLTPHGGVVGIILNTVKQSQNFAEKCVNEFGEENIELLHSAFIATDRYKKERQLIDSIGKGGKRPQFKIIIGTQVIEQSLDIDFDVLITDLAPMDLLLQRMGRLHRHSDTKRPENLRKSQVYVLNCGNYDFNEASTYVYAKYLLFRTEYFLPDKVNLPNDISHLVQLVYSGKTLNLSDDSLNKDYNTYQRKYNADTDKKEQQAKVYRLVNPRKKISQEKNLSDWIKNSDHSAELSDVNAYAQVRDSADRVEVIALKKCEGGYEFFDKSGKLDPIDNKTAMEIAKRTIQLSFATYYGIGIDEVIKALEKYYLEHFQDWNQQSWLKGSLAIIFDQNDEFRLFNKILRYNNKYGLKVITEDINERL